MLTIEKEKRRDLMLSPALKKLAQEHQLQCAHGIAYGSLAGYSVTLSDGACT